MPATPSHLDRVRGCLLGGAVGDALGAAVEFLSRAEILQRFGPAGITAPARAYGRIGAVTDDTQMTLFTAEGLIRALVRWTAKGICHPPGIVHHAYLRWLLTQGERPAAIEVGTDGWLFGVRALHSRRAPGTTCIAALRGARALGEPAENGSKGCGGVMRVAPAAFCFAGGTDLAAAFDLGADIAHLTHGHPTGYLAAGHLAALLTRLAAGDPLPAALDTAERILRGHPHAKETLAAVGRARDAAAHGPDPDRLAGLGQGWIAEEALAIAIYAALAVPDFRAALVLAASHDGDSDSTASMAGQILGARDGIVAVPRDWLAELELKDVIEALAADLATIGDIGEEEADRLWDRYPGW